MYICDMFPGLRFFCKCCKYIGYKKATVPYTSQEKNAEIHNFFQLRKPAGAHKVVQICNNILTKY